MTDIVHVDSEIVASQDEKTEFQHAIRKGLSNYPKKIQSKYFYDKQGSEIFNQITRHPDYYLTNCELEILNTHKKNIATLFKGQAFNLVELGPGEGIKTKKLFEQFVTDGLEFSYIPVDISANYLQHLTDKFSQQLPQVEIIPLHADFFKGVEFLRAHSNRQNVVLFLGSSIGNYDPAETLEFLLHLRSVLNVGDYVLLGVDLRKDVDILMRAYNDKDGITREFNLNLLRRINRELNADFDLTQFAHYATYNVHTGAMESYLISLAKQTVTIHSLAERFHFEAIEPIHVEYSFKYLLPNIEELAETSGFQIIQHFTDSKQYFVDSLWCAR